MEAHKWREVDKERIFVLITALLIVLVTDSVMFFRENLRPWCGIAYCRAIKQWLNHHFVFPLKNGASEL